MSVSQAPPVSGNKLLAALPAEEYQRLAPHLEFVSLPLGQVIYEPGEPIRDVYFPHQALISLVSIMEDGSTTEIGLVGYDGIVGLPMFLGGRILIGLSLSVRNRTDNRR